MSVGIDIETVVKVVIVDRIPTDPKADPKDDAGGKHEAISKFIFDWS